MDRKYKQLLIFGLLWSEVRVLIMVNEIYMELWKTFILAIAPVLVTVIFAVIISRKSYIDKLNDRLDTMKNMLIDINDIDNDK